MLANAVEVGSSAVAVGFLLVLTFRAARVTDVVGSLAAAIISRRLLPEMPLRYDFNCTICLSTLLMPFNMNCAVSSHPGHCTVLQTSMKARACSGLLAPGSAPGLASSSSLGPCRNLTIYK